MVLVVGVQWIYADGEFVLTKSRRRLRQRREMNAKGF
jgi:hypothetical protein